MFLGLPPLDPDPLVKGMDPDPDPSVIKKNRKKSLDSYCFVTWKNYVNIPSKSNKQKNFF